MNRYLEAGKIVSTHGIHGELKIYPFCDSAKMLVSFKSLFSDSNGSRKLPFERLSQAGNMAIVKIAGVDTIEDARKYIDKVIYFDKSELSLEEGRYFIDDLLSSRVVDDEIDMVYGELIDVSSNGVQDIYHIKMKDQKVRYVPAVPVFIKSVDIVKKEIRIKPIPGMLED